MPSKSILELNVGGQLFQTNIQTLCKYPDSMLCAMFSHTDSGLIPMPQTEKGHFFLDVNPIYFGVVLDWLRLGKVISQDPNLLTGTLALADYFGLEELTKELKRPSRVERSYEIVDKTIADTVRHLEEALSTKTNPSSLVILGHLRNSIKLSGGYAINKLAANLFVDMSMENSAFLSCVKNDFTLGYYFNAIKEFY